MVLDKLCVALSGASGAALACCFVAAAAALRWSGRRPARRAAARARQRQQAALESMEKAAQRFRLQVIAGSRLGRHQVEVPQQHLQLPAHLEGQVAGSAGVWEEQVCNFAL